MEPAIRASRPQSLKPSAASIAIQRRQRNRRLANRGLVPGTGFLPPETGARKRASATLETHRDRNAKSKARDVPAKEAVRGDEVEGVVSRDWVVGASGLEPGTR